MKTDNRASANDCARRISSRAILATILAGASASFAAMGQTAISRSATFDIPAQPVESALHQFAKQADVQILVRTDAVSGAVTSGIKGHLSISNALSELLRGTHLVYEPVGSSITVKSDKASEDAAGSESKPKAPDRSRALDERTESSTPQPISANGSSDVGRNGTSVEEVVVTGSHIRGLQNASSPIQIYTRDDIERSAVSTIKDFVQRLPQNFGGVASEDTIRNGAGGRAAGQNDVSGTAVNLRGLGPDATLVLINGRRVAPGNVLGNWVDVSMIPVAAVERIEVLSDGASAIYGADAVGGVVNFVMRKDFDGVDAKVRYGESAHGDPAEVQAAITGGHTWAAGSALVAYEYLRRSALSAGDRSYTASTNGPFSLLPKQERHSVFASFDQRIGERIDVFANGSYSQRSTSGDSTTARGISTHSRRDIDAASGTFGGRLRIADAYQLELASSYAQSDTTAPTYDLVGGGLASDEKVGTSVLSLDAKLDGPLGRTWAGPIRFAVGSQYRKEDFDAEGRVNRGTFANRREVMAGFAEINVPLIEASENEASPNTLELSVADRYERYSDFGSTNNPKFGLSWAPWKLLKLRGTYGKSFKAPVLTDLNPTPFSVTVSRVPDPLGGREVDVLNAFGGNANLMPEKATAWTIGFDVRSQEAKGFRANATYYSINFIDRITSLSAAGIVVEQALRDEERLGSQLVKRDPPVSLAQALVANNPLFIDLIDCLCVSDPSAYDFSNIGAFVDSRVQNFAKVKTSGIDASVSYVANAGAGLLEGGIDATYILEFDNQLFPTTPVLDTLDSPYNPIDLRLRARAIYQLGSFTGAAFVNYTDSYVDNRTGVPKRVDSWATVDVSLAYEIGGQRENEKGLTLQLNVTNLIDEDPPFVRTNVPRDLPGINFDGANANVLGRTISVQLSKHWR